MPRPALLARLLFTGGLLVLIADSNPAHSPAPPSSAQPTEATCEASPSQDHLAPAAPSPTPMPYPHQSQPTSPTSVDPHKDDAPSLCKKRKSSTFQDKTDQTIVEH